MALHHQWKMAETMGPLTEGLGGSLGGLGDSISGLDLPSLGL